MFEINISIPLRLKTTAKVFKKGVLRSLVRIVMKQIQEMYLFPNCYESVNYNFEVVAKKKVCEIVSASLWYTTTDSV